MKKRILSIFMLMAMSFGLVSGCAGDTKPISGNDSEQAETDNKIDDATTLDWYINYSWFVARGDNAVSNKLTEETGVNVNYVTPIGNETEKLNALIASDSLPDIITLGWWEPQIREMIDRGMVYSLNELADKYDKKFYEVADSAVVDWYTKEDGNIYCYPNSSYTPRDLEENDNIPSNQTFLVRKDIYEAIGSPDMSTPEGFYQAVVDAKEMFPEVNGQPLIPIGAHEFDETGCVSFDKYLQNFLAIPYEKDGKYYNRCLDEEYLSWLKIFRRLNDAGCLASDIFVDTRIQTSEKIADGRYFCMFYQRTDLADQQKILYDRDPNGIYMAVDGPRNSKGDDPVLPSTGITGWTVTLITKNCKNPERAIKLMDYLMSEEGQKLIYLGVEGVTYDIKDGKPVIKEDVAKLLAKDRESYDKLYGADDTYWMLQNNVMQLKWQGELEEPTRQMAEWTYPYTKYLGQYEIQMLESSEIGQVFNNYEKLWSETLKKLLIAQSDEEFDEIVEQYRSELETEEYKELIEEETRQVNANKAKLGLD